MSFCVDTLRSGGQNLLVITGLLNDIKCGLHQIVTAPDTARRVLRSKRFRQDIRERLGMVAGHGSDRPVIWIHGVNIGEINAARPLINALQQRQPQFDFAISTTTDPGMTAAVQIFRPRHRVFRWPLDFRFSVRNALRRIQPRMVVIVENDLWPNFMMACGERNIPVVLTNGRMSSGAELRRHAIGWRPDLLNRLAVIGVQTQEYARQYASMGVDPDLIRVTGMLKYDSAEVADRIDGQEQLASAIGLGSGDALIVAGSTGPGEEEMLLGIYTGLRKKHCHARLAIIPRLPRRFEDVAKLIARCGFPCLRRSRRPDGTSGPIAPDAVILGDTVCELRKFYALAAAVFVGRSLVPMGGSDMIEAAALGKPTAFGPHTYNFPQAELLAANGCTRVADAPHLQQVLDGWLSDPAGAKAQGKAARECVLAQQGATARNVELICEVLAKR